MAVRSQRLAGPVVVVAAGQVLFTVPANRVALVKMITITNASAAAMNCSFQIGAVAVANRVLHYTTSPTDPIADDGLWLVLREGESFTANTTVATTATVAVFGALLLGDAT